MIPTKFKQFGKLFFDPDHIVKSITNLLIGAIIFLLGIWYNSDKQPSKVYVVNESFKRDTMIVKFDRANEPNDTPAERYLIKLTNDVTYLRKLLTQHPELFTKKQSNIEPMGHKPLSYVEGSPEQPVKIHPIVIAAPDNIANIALPRLTLPSVIKGYYEYSISTIARVGLQKHEFAQNELAEVTVELLDNNNLDKLTPLFVSVLRKESENSSTLLFQEQYIIRAGKNIVRFSADFAKGKYELQVGLYFREELNREFPPLYRSQFQITVQ